MSRNKQYEERQKAKGLVKATVWISTEALPDLIAIADYCKNNRDTVPSMVRDLKTGRLKRFDK